MSHVDEGELHVWLDGALEALGAERADAVRTHLRGCAACREALVAEEALRAEAARLLASTGPEVGETPPFEALLAQARAGPAKARSGPARVPAAVRLGWAASILVAVGAGWSAHALVPRGAEEAPSAARAPAAVRAPSAEGASSAGGASANAGPPAPVAPAAAERETIETMADPAPAVTAEAGPARGPVAPASVPEPGREEGSRTPPLQENGVASQEAAARRRTVASARDLDARPPAAPAAARFGDEILGGSSSPPRTLAVAGLEVLAVEWLELAPGYAGLRVLQRLEGGDTLETRFVRRAADGPLEPPAALTDAPLQPGWSQVVRAFADGWWIARAPIPRERLAALLDQANR